MSSQPSRSKALSRAVWQGVEPSKAIKPQLHVSMLEMMARCGIQFQRRYGHRFGVWDKEEIIPPSIALAVGISVHKAVEQNLRKKMEIGQLLSREEVGDIAFHNFSAIWNGEMYLTPDEIEDVKTSRGIGLDQAVALSRLHHSEIAPNLKPLAVEEEFVVTISGFPFDLAGKKDVREAEVLRDVKTMRSSPPADSPKTMQMATYSMVEMVERGSLPKKVAHDCLVKTKTPKAVIVEAVPDESWIDPVMRRIERATEIIETVREGKEAFAPASPGDWVCTAKFCGYHATCPFWSGK